VPLLEIIPWPLLAKFFFATFQIYHDFTHGWARGALKRDSSLDHRLETIIPDEASFAISRFTKRGNSGKEARSHLSNRRLVGALQPRQIHLFGPNLRLSFKEVIALWCSSFGLFRLFASGFYTPDTGPVHGGRISAYLLSKTNPSLRQPSLKKTAVRFFGESLSCYWLRYREST